MNMIKVIRTYNNKTKFLKILKDKWRNISKMMVIINMNNNNKCSLLLIDENEKMKL